MLETDAQETRSPVWPAVPESDGRSSGLRAPETIGWLRRQVAGVRVLIIGAAAGELCLALARDGLLCTGLDWPPPLLVAAAPVPVTWRVSLSAAEAANLPFADRVFDSVIVSEALAQTAQPEPVLREVRRVLCDAGVVLVTVPYGLSLPGSPRQVYYPFSLLERLQPHFQSFALEVQGRHLCYGGRKQPQAVASSPHGLTGDLESLWLLAGELERHCLAVETALVAALEGRPLPAAAFDPPLFEADEALVPAPILPAALPNAASRQKPDAVPGDLRSQERKFQAALRKQQADFNEALALQEAVLKRAWNWRVGGAVLAPFKLLIALLRKPRQFPAAARQLWHDYRQPVYPPPFVSPSTPSVPSAPAPSATPQEVVSQPEPPPAAPTVGAILDVFTTACLRPECRLVTFRPDNWQAVLEQQRPDLIFVESAWQGNDGAWQYRLANYTKRFGDELKDLLAWARRQGVPSVLWNKEDPVHFDRFIEKAGLFDSVFTSDANTLPRYRERLGHNRVYALPFAAQPRLHNPVRAAPPDRPVCFAGTYYGDRHSQRREDLEFIVRPALDYGLDIYDRQYAVVGRSADLYRFPEIYQPHIRGRLEYADMVHAYKRYRVFLNVNSVKDSPTMFSRRVFELLACGTPVISSHARGIVELLGEDTVFLSESEADTRRHLERLLNDDEAWMRASVKGLRTVMTAHTYAHRLAVVLDALGLRRPPAALPTLGVLASVSSPAALAALQDMLARQTRPPAEVVLLLAAPGLAAGLEPLRQTLARSRVTALAADEPARYARCLATPVDYLALMDPRHYYGPNYLLDSALAGLYGGHAFIGRHTHFRLGTSGATASLQQLGREFQLAPAVPSATLVFRPAALSEAALADCLVQPTFVTPGQPLLSIDRFNFLATNAVNCAAECLPADSLVRQQVEG